MSDVKEITAKRKAEGDVKQRPEKVSKGKKWQTPKKSQTDSTDSGTSKYQIEEGDAGIWATCERGREAKCVGELRDLLEQYATSPEEDAADERTVEKVVIAPAEDIEAELKQEVSALKTRRQTQFRNIKIDIQCLLFMTTPANIDPVTLVHDICKDSVTNARRKRGRWIKRLVPITLMGKATEKGLTETARKVLEPHFHAEGTETKKFAIRPSIRAHDTLGKKWVIDTIAQLVGPRHSVNLKKYDCLIVVEIYKAMCGMSVLSGDYDELKKYNLSELYNPAPQKAEEGVVPEKT
ncbi:MAG: hypothetical protein M1814_004132 [Vezdaea aestivalis]|nr:MAG: hypothetical protein M1814_004132 [Vezdaea aestivalis]